MRRLQHDGRRDTRVECLVPALSNEAPAVADSSPGNIHCGWGVTRSFPRERVNSRNSSVMTAQTTWTPRSPEPVRQYPSR